MSISQNTHPSFSRFLSLITLTATLLGSAPSVSQAQVVSTTTTVETMTPSVGDSTSTIREIPVPASAPTSTPVIRTLQFDMTAYTSTREECDNDPFITADGSRVRDGIIATNVLPFGTKVRFPDVFGDRVFEVHDRMNARYTNRADVWMSNARAMRQFGIKHRVRVEVIEMGTGETEWARRTRAAQLSKTKTSKPVAIASVSKTVLKKVQ